MRWHVAFTESSSERESCGKITELGFEAYVPLEKHKRWVRARRIHVELPLFPNYLFAKFDSAVPSWNAIREVDGVRDILSNQQKPLAVPVGLIEKMQHCQRLGLFDKTKKPMPFPPGSEVVLDHEGPFSEFIGKVLRVRTDDRADLLIKYLGKEWTVNVSLARLSNI